MRRREERRRGEEGKRKIGIIKDYDYTSTLIEFPRHHNQLSIFGTTTDGKLVSGMGSIKASPVVKDKQL